MKTWPKYMTAWAKPDILYSVSALCDFRSTNCQYITMKPNENNVVSLVVRDRLVQTYAVRYLRHSNNLTFPIQVHVKHRSNHRATGNEQLY